MVLGGLRVAEPMADKPANMGGGRAKAAQELGQVETRLRTSRSYGARIPLYHATLLCPNLIPRSKRGYNCCLGNPQEPDDEFFKFFHQEFFPQRRTK